MQPDERKNQLSKSTVNRQQVRDSIKLLVNNENKQQTLIEIHSKISVLCFSDIDHKWVVKNIF